MGTGKIYELNRGIEPIIMELERGFPEYKVEIDPHLRMFEELVQDTEQGNKIVTIRFYKGMIRIPNVDANQRIKVMQTTPKRKYEGPFVATLRIPKMFVSTAEDFPEEYAKLDNYRTKEDMILDISGIYLKNHELIQPTDMLSMYWLEDFRRI